jgi:microsomal dipeptidase-like Zn-dependent dipeptidase
MKSKPIFDAHLHILLKPILTGYQMGLKKKSTDPWSKIKIGPLVGVLLGKTLKSQANLNQIKEANASLVVHALFSPDYSLIDAGLVDGFGAFILRALRKKAIEILKFNAPKDNLLFELNIIEFIKTNVPNNQLDINCLTSTSSYDSNKINLVFNIEGAHNFYDKTATGDHYLDKAFLNTLKADLKYRICFVNLTHVQQWWACTHAYALKLLDNCISNKDIRYMFKPSGYGIQKKGFEIMETLLDNTNGQRMLIDIKHMSLFSRIQYYAWRRQKFSDVPIVASHVGLTGRSWNKIKGNIISQYTFRKEKFKCYRVFHNMDGYKGHLEDTNFYPNSINLYDEEIIEIINSKGLIGISLDKRILGSESETSVDDIVYNDEYMSDEEYKMLFGATTSILSMDGDDGYILDRSRIDQDYGINSNDGSSIRDVVAQHINTNYVAKSIQKTPEMIELVEKEEKPVLNRQIEHFINTVLHLVMIGGEEAWGCICIGSDFDGLITPIKKIKSVADLPKLRSSVSKYIKDNSSLWKAFNVSSIDDIDKKVQMLFFENGKRFVERIL